MELPRALASALCAADEDYLIALCNKGTVNRAKKDLAAAPPKITGACAAGFAGLAAQCEACGLHTGGALMERLAGLLEARAHTLHKQDDRLLEVMFQAEHYIALCRERCQELEILRAWQEQQAQEAEKEERGDLT